MDGPDSGAFARFFLVVALSCSVTACAGGSVATIALPTTSAAPVLAGGAAPKTPISGLIDMQDIAWHLTDAGQPTFVIANAQQFPGVLGGIVINATWSNMQPVAGGAVVFSAVDSALADVRSYNASNPSAPLSVKLRIYHGDNAPLWAKQLAGGPISIFRNSGGCDGQVDTCPETIGLLWSAPYIAAWRAFQAQVAAKYDAEPLIHAVAVTSCATQTDEPFVPTVGPVSKANLGSAAIPFSDSAEQACLSGAMDDYSAWKNTEIDFTFNTYTKFTGGTDPAFTTQMMMQCRTAVGARCVLDNHALQTPTSTSDAPVYTEMQALGGLVNFQTQSPEAMGCIWPETISQGVQLGARAIEIWPETKYQGFDTLTLAQMQQLAGEFAAPTALPGTPPLPSPCSGFN
jgi:hypothetical protein